MALNVNITEPVHLGIVAPYIPFVYGCAYPMREIPNFFRTISQCRDKGLMMRKMQ